MLYRKPHDQAAIKLRDRPPNARRMAMADEESWFERLKNRSNDEHIAAHLESIMPAFSDVFEKYSFRWKTSSVEIISFENERF